MDTKKTIIVLIVVGIVFWIFWIMQPTDSIPTALKEGLGLETTSLPTGDGQVQPVSLAGHPQFGNYLTDASGMTLYVTTKTDCAGVCLTVWPPYIAPSLAGDIVAPLGVAENKDAGVLQYTWNGKFLYYYTGDRKPGDISGKGFSNAWFLVQE